VQCVGAPCGASIVRSWAALFRCTIKPFAAEMAAARVIGTVDAFGHPHHRRDTRPMSAPAPAFATDVLRLEAGEGACERPSDPWRDQLQLLLESTGEGIFGIDLRGCCTFINRAGAQLLGYSAEEVLGRNMHCLIHHAHPDGSHYPEDDCPIFRAFRQGLPCRIDSEVLWRRDGSSFPAEYSSYPIVDAGRVRGAVVTFVDISERKRADELLRQANEQLEQRVAERTRELSAALERLRELSAYLHRVREDERTRIAREIHDELGSLLVALKFDVNWLRKRVAAETELARKCQSMGRLIEGAVDNVGRIITDLRPSILDHQGLWAALEWQAQEFSESTEIACDWRMHVPGELPAPGGPVSIAVFRIFQEMLSNVARHAHASSVRVDIDAAAGRLVLEVADNGQGASACKLARPGAYGVLGMRERARHFGGELSIESRAGAGTTVRLQVPWATPTASHDEERTP
jgi:PAS domain S-box-containing protein